MPDLIPLCTEEYVRFLQLITWAQSIGTCFQCSIACACATVQREAGNKEWGKPPNVTCSHEQFMLNNNICQDLFVTNWKDAPKR